MSTSLINFDGLSEPAKVLIEKVSEGVSGLCKPWQIGRVAKAEAGAQMVFAQSQLQISELQKKALTRLLQEEERKQQAMEDIVSKSLPQLDENASPEKIEADWIINFFDKCRLVTDQEMQNLWASILAGEANSPGRFSKRTINFLNSLDKEDALLFSKLCSFSWDINGPTPIIFDTEFDVYKKHGIYFASLQHLDSIGLINFEALVGFVKQGLSNLLTVSHGGVLYQLDFRKDGKNDLKVGKVLFTSVGQELSRVCSPVPVDGFAEFVGKKWKNDGVDLKKRVVL